MKEDAPLRLTIEGNTCSIGTAEYNLALGERRANAARQYLSTVGADRLGFDPSTMSNQQIQGVLANFQQQLAAAQ